MASGTGGAAASRLRANFPPAQRKSREEGEKDGGGRKGEERRGEERRGKERRGKEREGKGRTVEKAEPSHGGEEKSFVLIRKMTSMG